MIGANHRLTAGYVVRHIPPQSRVGLEIAIIDIAQDFLLAHLHEQGLFEVVTFKGGTALRKLYAGGQGRFSTDIDLGATEVGVDRTALGDMIAAACNVALGPFTFASNSERNRWQITVSSEFGNPTFKIKLDVGPPAWLEREHRAFVTTPIQSRYGFTLPELPSMRLEEILAEKIARLARQATARDASDLVWVAQTSPHSQFNRPQVRELASLKVWVDNNGLQPGWEKAVSPAPLDPNKLLASGRSWDDENIGKLSTPPPSLTALESGLRKHYRWLDEMTAEEMRWASADPRLRSDVLKRIGELDGSALTAAHLY